eukprot:UN4931
MVLALNVSVYFCKLLPLHMNGNLPVGIGMHVFAMICDLMNHRRHVQFFSPTPHACTGRGASRALLNAVRGTSLHVRLQLRHLLCIA